MPLGVSDSPRLVWVYACVCVHFSCRGCEVLACLSYYANGVELIVSSPAGCYWCSYRITPCPSVWHIGHVLVTTCPWHMRAGLWDYICDCALCSCARVCRFVWVPPFVFLHECVRFLPALPVHHGAHPEQCCVSASLGVSLRLTEGRTLQAMDWDQRIERMERGRKGLGNKTKTKDVKQRDRMKHVAIWGEEIREI